MNELTASRLRELLKYDAETGIFRWRVKRRKVNAGDIAGVSVSGKRYQTIGIDHKTHLAHRLAWLYCHGRWPDELIDHIDQNPFNNRISNLREASAKQNMHNRRGDADSASGIKGVCFRPALKKWEANIMCGGAAKYLGLFKTPGEASDAYKAAAAALHGEFAVGA